MVFLNLLCSHIRNMNENQNEDCLQLVHEIIYRFSYEMWSNIIFSNRFFYSKLLLFLSLERKNKNNLSLFYFL